MVKRSSSIERGPSELSSAIRSGQDFINVPGKKQDQTKRGTHPAAVRRHDPELHHRSDLRKFHQTRQTRRHRVKQVTRSECPATRSGGSLISRHPDAMCMIRGNRDHGNEVPARSQKKPTTKLDGHHHHHRSRGDGSTTRLQIADKQTTTRRSRSV